MTTAAVVALTNSSALGFGLNGHSGMLGGARWNAESNLVQGNDRSLVGGLSWQVETSSITSYKGLFSWLGTPPTDAQFLNAIQGAFDAWTVTDPVTGLDTDLSFAQDPIATATSNTLTGAEIDLLAVDWGSAPGTAGNTYGTWSGSSVKLTSGTENYSAPAITGVDIRMNSNPNASWTADIFQLVLTHEVGHALGLSDVDVYAGPAGVFIDDNYDASDPVGTLTNSFADLIDPYDPANSPGLDTYYVANSDPGFDTPGVDILMETQIPNLIGADPVLQNDDFAARQFLYPYVPEPATCLMLIVGILLVNRGGLHRLAPRR